MKCKDSGQTNWRGVGLSVEELQTKKEDNMPKKKASKTIHYVYDSGSGVVGQSLMKAKLDDFENISEFKAAGISSSILEYSHADRITYSDQKIKYYQLLQRDVDGAVTKYGPIAVDLSGLPTEILLYPNPASNELTFQVDSDLEIQKIEVTTLDGKRVVQLDYNFQNRLDLTDLPDGTYLLSMFGRDQVRQATKRFIKKVI